MALAMPWERITIFCFAASYAVALGLELWHLLRPRPIVRVLSLGFGAAGLVAQLGYLFSRPWSLAAPGWSLLFLALILAVFYLYGSLHHQRIAWGLFVLPLMLGLIGLAVLAEPAVDAPRDAEGRWAQFWGFTHGILLLLAAVGVCVGFVASVMYLVQLYRLRSKMLPGKGVKLLSLERLEAMNRRAVLWAFPLLTAGLLVGIVLQAHRGDMLAGWDSPKILSGLGLWLVFAILLFLRYGARARGRQMAVWTIVAFVVLLAALASPVHPFVQGAAP
jgi:ABC-type transport system involved in cytochrome c biogenesis permease subunit